MTISQLIGRFRRRSAPFCKAGTVLDVMRTTLGHGSRFVTGGKFLKTEHPAPRDARLTLYRVYGGYGGGQHGGGRGGLHGGLRGKYANCAACRCQGCVDGLQGVVSFLNHPWLASESSGEQSF